jgi:hypothetical protein
MQNDPFERWTAPVAFNKGNSTARSTAPGNVSMTPDEAIAARGSQQKEGSRVVVATTVVVGQR